MLKVRNLLALATAVITLSFVNVSAQNFTDNSGQSSKSIEQQVFKKIKSLPRYGVFDLISFQVKGDTVILGGKTNSLGTRRDAAAAVKRVPGVNNVVNNIEELPPSPFDDQIRRRTLSELASRGLYRYLWEPNPSVRIIVDRGHVSLEGYVAHRGDSNLMNILANGVSGVFSVQNNLVVGKDDRYR